ncbi:MAG: transcription-repair coupling factor [Pseudomonadota bacterium]
MLLKPQLPTGGQRSLWRGVAGSGLGLAVAEAAQSWRGPTIVVLSEPRNVQLLGDELHFYLPQSAIDSGPVTEFSGWECLPYDVFSPHQEIISDRLRLLSTLGELKDGVVLTTAANLLQRLPPKDYVLGHSFSIKSGDRLDLETIKDRLVNANYVAVSQVIAPGEFAIRGGLLDVFPMGCESPFRIDLFDDEVESIRLFNPDTQRSSDRVDRIELLPAREFPMTESGIKTFRQAFRRSFEGDPRKQTVYTEISAGQIPAGAEFFFPLFFETTATLFDYLSEGTLFVVESTLAEDLRTQWAETGDRYTNANYDASRKVLPPGTLYLNPDEALKSVSQFNRVVVNQDTRSSDGWDAGCRPTQRFPADPRLDSPYEPLLEHLRTSKNATLMVAETPGRREAMEGMLSGHKLSPMVVESFEEFMQKLPPLGLCIAPIDRGLRMDNQQIEVITESQLYGEKVFQRRRRSQQSQDPESLIRSLAELNPGDPVVHVEHGVGRYVGLSTIDIYGDETEFLTIAYENDDKLYVPVLSLNLISRFVGGSPESAPIHRLGGEAWSKAKKRAREKAYDVAAELLEVAALRSSRNGRAFAVPKEDYDAFVGRFVFEETPDQTQAISEVIDDLCSMQPMDRLVCGDVGFGKTEVALRAAFIAVHNNCQVAMLVPTTLLAQQHFQTFLDRFAELSISVELLSRFKSKKENDTVVEKLKQGLVDIVIGTHKLLQDDIRFKNLGLLMIDEEHRFGVRQKEKIKRMRSEVDILTLTATPIPRTLNISMAGLRSISIIATPPPSRLSIKTFVRDWNEGLIREACLREVRRGGQVYFLHNDVRTIPRMVEELSELVPEATIHFAHGQMGETQLERIMQDFYHQRFNVLVCSTIVESGIDIPSANTIIINRADRFGLAQLHQLRGRVGRSHHQAFAYLLIPGRKLISGDARKRLDAIDSMEDLGAGFALASHDLEIRGAGELLGETQSGSIDDVGFSLYSEYLSQAINSIKNNSLPNVDPIAHTDDVVQIDLHIPALFPTDYLANAHTRLVLYKRIASAKNDEQLDELQIEVIDRFGLLPESARNLFRLTSIRLLAEQLGIRKLDIGTEGGEVTLSDRHRIDPIAIIQLVQDEPHHYKLSSPTSFRLIDELAEHEIRLAKVDGLLKHLRRHHVDAVD